MSKREINIIITALILLVIVITPLKIINTIDIPQTIEIIILFALVLVTTVYVNRTAEIGKATKEQAEASVKMADEMKEQRYDTVRPIIDIIHWGIPTRQMGEQISSMEDLEAEGLSCIFLNIGFGPAIDLYSFVQNPTTHIQQKYDFGTSGKDDKTNDICLSIKDENGHKIIAGYYKDIYERPFESKRELIGEVGNWKLGPLKIRQIKEDELPR